MFLSASLEQEREMAVTMVRFKLVEASALALTAPVFFALVNWIDGTRPLITEFEAGGITTVVLLKLLEALRAAFGQFP